MKRKKLPDEDQITIPKKVSKLCMGRLDQKLISSVCELAAKGVPLSIICDFLGITQHDMKGWISTGKKALTGAFEMTAAQEMQALLYLQYAKATAAYRIELIEELKHPRFYERALMILERVEKKNYSKQVDVMNLDMDSVTADERFI